MRRSLTILILILTIFTFTSCSKKDNNSGVTDKKPPKFEKKVVVRDVQNKKSGVIDILPSDLQFLLKIGSIDTVYKNLNFQKDSIWGFKLDDVEEMVKVLGFNPFVLDDLKKMGFNTAKELGLTISNFKYFGGEKFEFVLTLFIPVDDGKKVLDKLVSELEKNVPKDELKIEKKDKYIHLTGDMDNSKGIYIYQHEGYLFFSVNPMGEAKNFMETVVSKKDRLSNDKVYKEVSKKVGDGEDIVMFLNVKNVLDSNKDIIQLIKKEIKEEVPDVPLKIVDMIKDYRAGALALSISKPDFLLDIAFSVNKEGDILNLLKDVTFDKRAILGMSELPVALVSFAINMEKYYDFAMGFIPEDQKDDAMKELKNFEDSMGISIKNDILKHLSGNMNFGVYDGSSITQLNYNLIATISLKNQKEMMKTIEKLIKKAPEKMVTQDTIMGVKTYIFNPGFMQFYLGVTNHNIIFTVGKSMYEKGIKSFKNKGFIEKIPHKMIKDELIADTNLFYLSVSEILKALNNFKQFDRWISDNIKNSLKRFDSFIASSDYKDGIFFVRYYLKTNFKEPFFLELMEFKSLFDR